MSTFRVTKIIDGDTFEVSPRWEWDGEDGDRIRPTKYNAPELNALAGALARQKLTKLILGETVELSGAVTRDRGRLVCDVFVRGQHLADYFPEYK